VVPVTRLRESASVRDCMGDLRTQFGARLRGLRQERSLTQEEFAELVGISVDFLSLIERGINAPSFETIEQIASRLDIAVSELFERED
jgi:transcriptional regulator with XRE-family HTH domain